MRRFTARLGLALVTVAVATGGSAPVASALKISTVAGSYTDAAGNPERQAGSHPDITFGFRVETDKSSGRMEWPGEDLYRLVESFRRVKVDMPVGLVGNPQVMETCPIAKLTALMSGNVADCPAGSQVGVASVPSVFELINVVSVEPPAGYPAMFAFNALGTVVKMLPSVRGGDYGITIDTGQSPTSQAFLSGADVTLWGVPADPIHDHQRWGPQPGTTRLGVPSPSTSARLPFLSLPTACSGSPLVTTAHIDGWDSIGIFDTKSLTADTAGRPFTLTGCERLGFTPSIDVKPTTQRADAPTGLDVTLKVPQTTSPDELATPHVKDVTVALPAGVSISPSAAAGLEACTDQQIGLGQDGPDRCPRASKIGTVSVDTPLLKEPVTGSVFAGSQESGDPQSGKMFRLFIVAEGPGVRLKLEGGVKADPATGQLTTTFANNPQLPFSALHMKLDGGPNGVLATAPACGAKSTDATISSWSGKSVALQSASAVDCRAGLGGFAPAFTAGTVAPAAGASSPFTLGITKPDGDAAVNGLSMVMPAGLLARLKGNLGTQVGSVTAYAGSGSTPFALPGRVYLEGRYGDAPFSLRVVVPAKAGPFDLGEVVVRQKIYVDPITAQVTVVSDPIPTIVKGVPVRLQRLEVSVDKPGFMVNPTSCAAKAITGTLSSAAGQSVPVTNRFNVGDCGALDLKPSLALSLTGKGQTGDGKHPAVTAELTQPAGQSNLKKVRVVLPLSLALDPDNANGLCEFVDGSKVTPTCPQASIVGSATAVTPILDEPMTGPVYFVKNVRKDPKSGRDIRTLPKLVIPMTGQNGVKLTLTGTSDVEDDRLVTTFDNIPDAAVSSFKLNIIGGKGGILAVSGTDICKATQVAEKQIDGHNGKAADTDVYIQTPACTLKVLSKKVGKRTVTLKVGGLGAGKVTITGKGIKKTSKKIAKSTVVTITAKRTKGTPGTVTVTYDPTGPAKPRKTTK
jgi:hypothetical protein